MEPVKRYEIIIAGIVQGVGFRPFIFNLAKSLSLCGWVNNSNEGVFIDIEGSQEDLDAFLEQLTQKAPPMSHMKSIHTEEKPLFGYVGFIIKPSEKSKGKNIYISPDIAICKDCEKEFRNKQDRRSLYPFINCTNCGPRFTIVHGIPYDRDKTTMDKFQMCKECAAEYNDPENRRYHAQPISCYHCGPKLELISSPKLSYCHETGVNSVKRAQELLCRGSILAVKGLGGYHLVCDALNENAVKELRHRKIRDDKPFAVMVKDMDTALQYCYINGAEKELLESEKKPIVLLTKRQDCALTSAISPGNPTLGLMLPYTPVHLLLFEQQFNLDCQLSALVMTSGNRSNEPIYFKEEEAFENLKEIADYFLVNDRDIYIRTDDSVTRIFEDKEYILRRARGYVPGTITWEFGQTLWDNGNTNSILACGGEQKNVFCISKGREFYLSHHIGDLENMETLSSFEEGVTHFKKIFCLEPEIVVFDLHPEYLSTKYALELDVKNKIAVQHHHAHIASCMAENQLQGDVIGVAFDGTGFGEDGNIWGGEFFYGNYQRFTRAGHLEYVPMPGGEMAVKEPWRMAVSYLLKVFGSLDFEKDVENGIELEFSTSQRGIILPDIETSKIMMMIHVIKSNINSPLTSSMGRLFDAVSAMVGVRSRINYEGQAAVELEYIADKKYCGGYEFLIKSDGDLFKIHVDEMIKSILKDLQEEVPKEVIAARFHETIANMVVAGCNSIKELKNNNKVVLSGGVFQNMLLLEKSSKKLKDSGFQVFTHSKVPTNDGGLSFGQAVIAAVRMAEK